MNYFAKMSMSLMLALSVAGCDRAFLGAYNGDAAKAEELTLRVEGTDYEAVKELQAMAQESNPYAALQIGYIYHSGAGGMPVNYTIARQYYSMAAESLSLAKYNLALMDYYALGQPKNMASAVKRLQSVASVAQAGQARALLLLGTIFSNGKDVQPNLPLAASYYEKAAGLGDVEAMYRLGSMIRRGAGRPRNLEQAQLWLSRAADNGHAKAMFELAEMSSDVDGYNYDLLKTAQWLVSASQYNDNYKPLANQIVAKLSPPEQKIVLQNTKRWLGAHSKHFEDSDLTRPLNK